MLQLSTSGLDVRRDKIFRSLFSLWGLEEARLRPFFLFQSVQFSWNRVEWIWLPLFHRAAAAAAVSLAAGKNDDFFIRRKRRWM